MPAYSKASRGLFVLVELGRVFTATAISPSESLRQLLARDAIRAGRNFSYAFIFINDQTIYSPYSCTLEN